MNHKHKFVAGWIRNQCIYRECSICKKVFMWYGTNKFATEQPADFYYYKDMAVKYV